ncbi:hypothetical protein G647_06895 [Cladophialophora carrionii CBS 160.54]|uniref:Uncharacterized protein n=1 Tax=Cladophialophora carrionii CBS 160.54 TaxID=1279043 RepID=V9D7B3_9EURO|nr:uncharacterized protein G647_06895 [Cladophialophora carrionii CBS 160.54]ETI22819.1 hypothetical protein G647_06895 [Cladophialophora carrionii CBS 160.54]
MKHFHKSSTVTSRRQASRSTVYTVSLLGTRTSFTAKTRT